MPGRLEAAAPTATLAPRLGLRRRARVARKIALIGAGLAVGLPLQWALLRLWPRGARWAPTLFHRYVCAVTGVRREVFGVSRGAALLVSNHMSWLDIVALSACRPTSFVGKAEIAEWPLFGTLARLQRTLFVQRGRRGGAAADADEIARRVRAGEAVTLFAEGTTSDGCGVLPFRSALLAGATGLRVQPVALAYVARDGVALDAAGRRAVAWHGDKALLPHLIEILALERLDMRIVFGAAAIADQREDRKALARRLEGEARRAVEAALR